MTLKVIKSKLSKCSKDLFIFAAPPSLSLNQQLSKLVCYDLNPSTAPENL